MKAAPASMPPTTPRMAAALRRILLLPRRGGLARGGLLLRAGSRGRLLPRSRLACRCGLETSQRRLEVVEDEPHGRIAGRRLGDARLPFAHDEHAALAGGDLELRERALTGLDPVGRGQQLSRGPGQRVGPARVRERRPRHLAAMIAYFALLAFVPLTFLSLSLLGLTGRADESSFLVKEIKHTLPGTPIDRIIDLVHTVQDNATALGLVGGAALLWTSLSLFSVLESAFNIVYGRPNRSFLHGKGLASLLMIGSLVTLFVALLAGSLGVSALKEYAPGIVANWVTAYTVSIAVSLFGIFVFLVSCYYVLTNEDLTVREVLPGSILAAIFLEGTFQILPLYQRYADVNPALRAFGAPAILLVWLYVMSNVIVFGAELNWWRSRRREQRLVEELAGLA